MPFTVTQTTTTKTTTFDVTGIGKATIKPDKTVVSAGVSATGATSQQVKNQINETMNAVSQAVKQLGISDADIKTSNYNINPTYNYTSDSQQITGYSGNTTLMITVTDLNQVNNIMDAVTKAGATNVNQSGFDITDKTPAENQARELAIADAKKKAETIASIAGFHLGKLVNYTESNDNFPRPVPLAGVAKSADVATRIEPGSQDVTVTVTLSYDIE